MFRVKYSTQHKILFKKAHCFLLRNHNTPTNTISQLESLHGLYLRCQLNVLQWFQLPPNRPVILQPHTTLISVFAVESRIWLRIKNYLCQGTEICKATSKRFVTKHCSKRIWNIIKRRMSTLLTLVSQVSRVTYFNLTCVLFPLLPRCVFYPTSDTWIWGAAYCSTTWSKWVIGCCSVLLKRQKTESKHHAVCFNEV